MLARRTNISLKTVLCLSVALSAAFCFYRYDPSAGNFFPSCPFHSFTGLDCPGCGSQRALHALLHGNIRQAADYNLLLVAGLPFVAFLFCDTLRPAGKYPEEKRLIAARRLFLRIAIWLTLCFWIARNLPLAPFTYLAS